MVSEDVTEELQSNLEPTGAPKLTNFKDRSAMPRFLKSFREWFREFRFPSLLGGFRRTICKREKISLSVQTPASLCHCRRRSFKEWLTENPRSIAVLIWLTCFMISLVLSILFPIGVLNSLFPSKQLKFYWMEANDQVLNALITLIVLYRHPDYFHHLVMLWLWRPQDIIHLRKIYCKDAAYRPHEWAHMVFVVVLHHVACIAQYAMCAVAWGFSLAERPQFLKTSLLALGLFAIILEKVYTAYSPLGREFDSGSIQADEVGDETCEHRAAVSEPEWIGGLFQCRDGIDIGLLSFFCTFCVFGWNMKRLGFGNMYVHTITFLLLCTAPFWVFGVAALKIQSCAVELKIHNHTVDAVLWILGIVLCVFGLLYGGFWRIQMRNKFGLPANSFCCGSASLTDYLRWMFCWPCSLAQEVRTTNFYDVEDDVLYRKLASSDEECRSRTAGEGIAAVGSDSGSELPCSTLIEESAVLVGEDGMVPPVQPLIQLDYWSCNGNGAERS